MWRYLRLLGASADDVLTLVQLTTLHTLDLSNLPKTSGAPLARLPSQLEALALDDNAAWTAAALRTLPALPRRRELDLYGTKCDATAVRELVGKHWPLCVVTMPNGARHRAP